MSAKRESFTVFFMAWAHVQRWQVPALHVRICDWLENCKHPERVLLVFRGAAKSTIYAVYKAWRLYCDPTWTSLIYAADDKLATKLTRDTIRVLRRHPFCNGMLPSKPGAQSFWVLGSTDARNPSMEAVGVNSNATGSRADDIDFDDIEVPKNIKTVEARENLRTKIEDTTHIAVPRTQKTWIGTPHTHDSIYMEQIAAGAAVLKIPLFQHMERYEASETRLRFPFPHPIGPDGLYVMVGIGPFAKLLNEGHDYRYELGEIVFASPPHAVVDVCSVCAWPERFTRLDVLRRRRGTKTLNAWDSQYHLEAKPVTATRLDPTRIRCYEAEPLVREANGITVMTLGAAQIVGAVAWWDCSLGKIDSDASAFCVVFTDALGQLYWHRAEGLTGDLEERDDKGRLVGGQCFQIRALVVELQLPCVHVETNGPGGFVPPILRKALHGTGCAVREAWSTADKRKRILDAIEAPMSSRFLWAHRTVLEGPAWDQMHDFNPSVRNQPDDYLDAVAGAIVTTPVRIGKVIQNREKVGNPTDPARKDWRPSAGTFEVEREY